MPSISVEVQHYIRKLSDAFFKVSNENDNMIIKDFIVYKSLRGRLEPHKQIIKDIQFQAGFEQDINRCLGRLSNIDTQKAQIAIYTEALESSNEPFSSTLITQLRLQNDNLNILKHQTNLEVVSLNDALTDLTRLKNVL